MIHLLTVVTFDRQELVGRTGEGQRSEDHEAITDYHGIKAPECHSLNGAEYRV